MDNIRDSQIVNDRSTIFSRSSASILKFLKAYWVPTLLLLPAFILFSMFFVWPAINMFISSFMKINLMKGNPSFIGISNYLSAFEDEVFIKSVTNTIIYTLGITFILVPFSLLVAVLIDCSLGMKTAVRGLLYIPSIIAMSIAALMWKMILSPNIGILNSITSALHLPSINWLGDPKYALGTVIFLGVWRALGASTILFIAGLKSMPKEQLEAAEVDGATALQSLFFVIIPNLKYIITFVTLTTVISSFQVFTTIQVLTNGGPNNSTNVLVFQIWQEGFRFFDMGKANAISVLMFIVLFIISMFMVRVMKVDRIK